jgi:hypothetical protein
MKSKKGQAVLYVYFIITAIIIVTIAAVLAPMGVRFNAAMYAAGEDILEDSKADIDAIQDNAVRKQVNATVEAALDAGANNIEVNAQIFQYSWVIVLILTAVVVFLNARRLVEVGAGGFI